MFPEQDHGTDWNTETGRAHSKDAGARVPAPPDPVQCGTRDGTDATSEPKRRGGPARSWSCRRQAGAPFCPSKGGSIPRNHPPKSPQGPCGILTFYDRRSLMPGRSRGASAAPSRHPTFHSSRLVGPLRAVGEVHQSDEEHRP